MLVCLLQKLSTSLAEGLVAKTSQLGLALEADGVTPVYEGEYLIKKLPQLKLRYH